MKKIKYIIGLFLTLAFFVSCEEETFEFGDIIAPSNLQITAEIVGQDVNPTGDGSGVVHLNVKADNAITYKFIYNGSEKTSASGGMTYSFGTTGTETYTITVVAYGTGGVSSSASVELEVLVVYEPPADLLTMLTGDSSRTWKIASEIQNHFGLGDVGNVPFQHYGAGPGAKEVSGMYDDRYTFNVDGTFTHDVGPDGFVFGREGLINELGGSGGVVNGADIEQYLFDSYTANWALTAPSDAETINLTGLGFVGYYVGGNHKYIIHERSANEMVIKTTDGNGQFDWWFRLIAVD